MSELAFNMNGEPFEVPATATGWRVRRMKHKGAPEVVYGRDGLPLVLPLEAEVEDLQREVGAPGRYRVDPVDGHRPIQNAPAGYVFVHDGDAPVALTSSAIKLAAPSDNVVIEAMRMNTEIARSVVDRFPMMLEAAATLLRAADGAGLPARVSVATGDHDEEDDGNDGDAQPTGSGFDLNALVAQIVPLLLMKLGNGKLALPGGLGALLDWRKAAPKPSNPKTTGQKVQSPTVLPTDSKSEDTKLPPISPQMMAHFIAIQSALNPEEAELAREVAARLGAGELRAWFDELGTLSVPDAVEKIRSLIQREQGGDS